MTVRYFLVFIALLHGSSSSLAAPVAVRFVEGVTHAFLVLGKANGPALASGDFLQIARGGKVESRTVFHFKDGSLFDESVTFTQHGVFKMPSYQLLRRGPAFTEDAQIWLGQPAGKYRVKTKVHKDGREDVLNGTIDLPQDVYNGMVVTVAKNLPKGSGETVHVVAFMPKPRLMQLELAPTNRAPGEDRRACKERISLSVQTAAGYRVQGFCQITRAATTRLRSLDQPRRDTCGSALRGTALRQGPSLAHRGGKPELVALGKPQSCTLDDQRCSSHMNHSSPAAAHEAPQ